MEDIAQAKINRGNHAKHLINDPVLNEAFDALIAEANAASDQSKPDDVDLREECHRAKNAIRALRLKLSYWVADGSMEQARLVEEEKKNAST